MCIAFFSILFLNGLQFSGPVYLADETGYLTKAAALAGHVTDTASSYHFGYSLFLAPAFYVLSPSNVWAGVMFMNALAWGASLFLLFRLIKNLFPSTAPYKVVLACAASAIYPSWIITSSYAFSSSLFVLILIVVLNLFVIKRPHNSRVSFLLGGSLGFLYWVHPLAIALYPGIFLVLLYRSYLRHTYRPLIVLFGTLAVMIIVYKFALHPLLNNIMTPDGYEVWNHYDDVAGGNISAFEYARSEKFWLAFFSMVLGQVSQIIIATFGIALFPVLELVRKLYKIKGSILVKAKMLIEDQMLIIVFLLWTAVVCASIMGSLTFLMYWGLNGELQYHHWIYGRYTELYIWPLLVFGLLSSWRVKDVGMILPALVAVGVMLNFITMKLVSDDFLNFPVIPSFWPSVLNDEINYLVWFIFGTTVFSIIVVLVRCIGKLALVLLIPTIFLTVNFQNNFHHVLERAVSVDEIVFSKNLFRSNTCIGFEYNKGQSIGNGKSNVALRLIAYENYNHSMQRMSLREWAQECEGPFITHKIYSESELAGAKYVAHDQNSGLYLITK